MAGQHADGEILAQLAMDFPVPAEVAAHVASCPECSKDLSLLKSLLAADGPDTPSTAEPLAEAADQTVPSMGDAMADGNDTRHPAETVASKRDQAAAAPASGTTAQGSGINPTALVVALVIFVGAALLAFFALR